MDQPDPVGREPLDFDKARFEEHAAELTCGYCKQAIADVYFDVNDGTCCESCRHQMEAMRTAGTPAARAMRALFFGGIGGALGAGLYYAVLYFTGYEIGLVAIVVGLLVGFGVRVGSGGVGGRGYQVLAVTMTYLAIVSTYVPFIVEQLMNETEAVETAPAGDSGVHAAGPETEPEPLFERAGPGTYVLAAIVVLLVAMAVPFLAGIQNIIGILIIGFALYEAWRVNAFQPFVVDGPFRCSAPTAAPSSPPAD